jgi:Ca2+-binding EF-hand superfamily protein
VLATTLKLDRSSGRPVSELLRETLVASDVMVRVIDLFREWDENQDGRISKHEFSVGMAALGIDVSKEEANELFDEFDPDGSGTIDKLELFNVLRELGQVPSGGNPKEKEDFLEKNFALADTNGDGVVDFDEFAEFYALTMDAIEQEQVARDAFQKYDVDGSNSLEKHELFHALLDLDLVPGMALGEKREYLEEQFAAADTNGDGIVDFESFMGS